MTLIEHKKFIIQVFKNYATIVIIQNNSKNPKSLAVPLLQKNSKLKQIKALTLKKSIRPKKPVYIDNAADKKKVKMLSTKDLIEALQAKIKSI